MINVLELRIILIFFLFFNKWTLIQALHWVDSEIGPDNNG